MDKGVCPHDIHNRITTLTNNSLFYSLDNNSTHTHRTFRMTDSEEDSVHLHTPPHGRGRCCAGLFCINPKRTYYLTYTCNRCNRHPHEQGCFIYEGSVYGRFDLGTLLCLQCIEKKKDDERKRQNREKAAARKEKKEILKKRNPFTIAKNLAKYRMK
jgi:hypothetical protein